MGSHEGKRKNLKPFKNDIPKAFLEREREEMLFWVVVWWIGQNGEFESKIIEEINGDTTIGRDSQKAEPFLYNILHWTLKNK